MKETPISCRAESRFSLKKRRRPHWFWVKALFVPLTMAGVGLLGLGAALPLVPLPQSLFADKNQACEFVDRHGQPLRTVLADGGQFQRRVSYAEIPLPLVQATLAAEDRRFWQHPGVDWKGTLRAAWQLGANRRIVSGGSTITQQLIKLAHPRPRTLRSKLIEAVQALRLEQVWDKQRILSEYLNRLEYGNFNTGCPAAAQFYFAKPLGDLSPAECALLAGLPQAPSRLNPHTHLGRARKRQQWILQGMNQRGWLTNEEFGRAQHELLRLAKHPRVFEAPHFIDLVLRLEGNSAGTGSPAFWGQPNREANTLTSARRVRTTLDLELNRFTEETLRDHLSRLTMKHVHNGSAVVIDNRSGHVLALVGSENYFAPAAGEVNGAWAPRSAGSTFKPFAYLLAFENGATPASIVSDVPAEFPTSTGLFAPVNYNRHCYGPVRYRVALANSLNISAVKVLAAAGGPEALRHKLQSCGLSTLVQPGDYYGLGLTIGNAEARLLELANAYACLARLGEFKPYLLVDVPGSARAGAPSARRVAEREAAYLIADILSDNTARTLAFGAESPLRFDFPVACKTGTSSDFRDNWAFGYAPEFTVGVWVGNFDGSPMQNVSGVSGAGPILHSLFERLHERYGTTWYDVPSAITEAWVHTLTGKRITEGNAARFHVFEAAREKFVSSMLPPFEGPDDYDSAGRVRLGSEYREWLACADNWLGGRAVLAGNEASVHILFPLPGTTFYLDPDLPQGGRQVHLLADGTGALQWSSDSLECREEEGQRIALLTEGRHRLVARDPGTGVEARTWVNVLAR